MKIGSIFHVLSWSSHKAKFPVRSIGAAEILTTGEAIDKGESLSSTLSGVFDVEVPLHIAL